jgi:hypothetical protein
MRETRRDVPEHRQPFADDARLEQQKARDIAARSRQAGDQARADRVDDTHKHDRDRAGLPLQRGDDRCRHSEDHIGLQGDQLLRQHLRASSGRCKAIVDANIAALRPSKFFEPLLESRKPHFRVWIAIGQAHQHTDPPFALGLLRLRHERPGGRRAAEKRDELAPS